MKSARVAAGLLIVVVLGMMALTHGAPARAGGVVVTPLGCACIG